MTNFFVAEQGNTVFFGKITLTLSPDRSVPSESGITSLNVTSDNNSDPERTPANTVAP